jgi:hypothetical protein
VKPKPPVPMWRWALWWALLLPALGIFYGLFTPVWFAVRAAAWAAGFKARRARPAQT